MIRIRLLSSFSFLILIFLYLLIFVGCEKKEDKSDVIVSEKIKQSELLLSENVNPEKVIKEVEMPDELVILLSKGYVIFAVFEKEESTILLLAEATNRRDFVIGNFILLLLSGNNEIIAYQELYSNSTYHPIYQDAFNLVVGFFNNEVFKAEIYIINGSEGTIESVVAEDRYIAEVFLYNKQLYYSTEKSTSAIKRIDLINNEFFHYRSPYLENASFAENEGIVYAIYEKQMYEITDDELIKTDMPIPKSYRKYAFRDFMSGDFSFYEELLGLEKINE